MEIPLIAKVLLTLGLILVLNRVLRQLLIAVAAGTAVFAFWSGHSFASVGTVVAAYCSDANTLFLLAVVFMIIWFSHQMARTGAMHDLVATVRQRLSPRPSMAVLPALIGMLPMPGGAVFSAPLVDQCDTGSSVTNLRKTQINYWFRHIWEYWWPLYPGVLLAVEKTGLGIGQFMLVQLPLTIVAVAVGTLFLLRPGEKTDGVKTQMTQEDASTTAEPPCKLTHILAPLILIVCLYLILRLAVPFFISDANKYLPMLGAVAAGILLHHFQRPLPRADWRAILLSGKTLNLAALVFVIGMYGAFIDSGPPGDVTVMEQVREELSAWHIPVIFMIMVLPFICGVATGISVGFVGTSFPVVMSLLGPDPGTAQLLATTVLAYGFGYMGIILSPVHVCLLVTAEHFYTGVLRTLSGLILPACIMLAFAVLMYAGILVMIPEIL